MRQFKKYTLQHEGSENFKRKYGSKFRQLVAAITVNLASLAYGMSLTWPTPSLPILNAMDPPITEEEGSWLASLVFIGAIIASPVFSYISQNYGRKIAGYCTVIPFSISWLLVVFFDSIPLYYISRFLGGFASGGVLAFCPMYIGEIAEDSIRGTLGTVRSMVVNIGAIIFCAVGPLVSLSNMAAICTVVPIIFAVCFLWLPESPMYLMKVGKVEEAKEAMTWLRGGNVVKAEEDIRKLAVVVEKSNSNVSFKELLSSKGTRRGLLICIVLAVAQQLSGVSAIMSFSVSLFESAGGLVQPTTASIIMTSVQLFGTIIASIFLDIAGRRILLIGSQITMTLSLGTLGTYFYLQELNFDLSSVGFVPMVCAAVYVLSICVGLITVSFVVMAEIFSPESRGLATSITTTIMWFMAFLTTRFYASIVNVIGLYGCYWFFALVCVASNIFTILKIPETKNRSLESILLELNGESAQNDVEDVNQQKDIKALDRY